MTDAYTKAVLTIIAGAVLYIGAMLSGQPASAQTMAPASQAFVEERQPQPVVIVGWGTVRSDGKVFVTTVRDVGGFTRTDGALYYAFADGKTRLALNVENLFDKEYFPTANGDNNISPGAPRNARLTLTTAF